MPLLNKKILSRNSQKAFTLIELMVVVIILAILVTIGAYYYTGIISKTRDVRRLVDLKNIMEILSAYFTDHGFYPTVATAGISSLACPISLSAKDECANLIQEIKAYSPRVPFDPASEAEGRNINCDKTPCYYYITPDPAHSVSCICANLEDASRASKPPACGSAPQNYCIQSSI